MTAVQAIEWLETFALMPPARAQQRIRFVDQYRSYVINYNLGKDIVARYVEALAGDVRKIALVSEDSFGADTVVRREKGEGSSQVRRAAACHWLIWPT
jgi:hypothetical protein